MQAPPLISPDGRFWWDGQTWQPMPSSSAPAVAPPAPDPSRPSWLAEGVEIPGPPPAAPPPNQAAYTPAEKGRAVVGAPAA